MSYEIVPGSFSGGVPGAGAFILTPPRVECVECVECVERVERVGSVAKRIINTGREVRP